MGWPTVTMPTSMSVALNSWPTTCVTGSYVLQRADGQVYRFGLGHLLLESRRDAELLLQVVDGLLFLDTRGTSAVAVVVACRVDLIEQRSVFLVDAGEDGLDGVRSHESFLRVQLGNVGQSLGQHVDRDVVAVVLVVLECLLSDALD